MRLEEHEKFIENEKIITGFTELCISNKHDFKIDNCKILHICSKHNKKLYGTIL